MKKITFLIVVILVMALYIDESKPMSWPEQCKGKNVTCSDSLSGTCYAVHCPGSTTYDDKGNVISRTEPCNPCTFYRSCWCGDYQFSIKE